MKNMLDRLVLCVFSFLGGTVAVGNLTLLIETNPDYDAQWWKVGLSILIPLTFAAFYGWRND